ncbi:MULTISPECIES: hypothetical protein [Chryseobacterium]|uniref:T9SS C-terminal target domain-containing protein n=2 Tax=Chryseobacterium TaxID=59732 RepID=A0A3M7TID0_9FLAO|nr:MULTISPECIES: hypothetical protein [Chryseobacterium]RNA63291.1 hypothetical protein D1631_15835 [Chryseobacterium nematophagum]CAA7387598.1 hypothetical protein CHRY9393_01748 [Chryseobacterium fistulae]
MKKQFITAMTVLMSAFAFGQVGVNTQTPQSTLDVTGTSSATIADGVLVPRYTVAELSAKDAAYGASQNGVFVFVTSGTGSSGKTSDVTGAGFYYYDNPTSKWKGMGGNTAATSFNVTAEQTSDYTVLATDDFVKLNVSTSGRVLTLPTTGIPVGKRVYISNIGTSNVNISPSPRNPAVTQGQAKSSGALVYLGGGEWDWVTGY